MMLRFATAAAAPLPHPSSLATGAVVGGACVRWSLALLLLALASHAPTLALAAWPVFALALASRLLPQRKWVPILRLVLLAGAVVVCGTAYGWLDSRSLRLALLLVLAFKWAEARQPGEFALLAAASVVAGAVGLLQWGEWAGLVLIAVLPLFALRVMETATEARWRAGPGAGVPPQQMLQVGRAAWRRALAPLRGNLARLALALPLAAALFVFFPRIPGPLWDIGLTFGLPLSLGLQQSNQGLGVSTRLKPGQNQSQTGVVESQPVLVAEFEHWVPPMSMLYWRGPVYYDFDGGEWLLDPEYEKGQGRSLMRQGWTKGGTFSDTLARKSREIAYTVRLTPHERLWLYGLDLPAGLAAESFISADWQVLSHRPVEEETRYKLKSWLEWEAGGTLDEALRRRALVLPEGGNPRLRALGTELAALPAGERAKAALLTLIGKDYKVREQFAFQEGPDAYDRFWFDTREGNADLYAGAFVFLMRAADMPARLVTGYRGGKLMALTDYVIVKKNHAHAWAEVWDESLGWRRVDPVDMLAPERFAAAQPPKPVSPKAAQTRTPDQAPPPARSPAAPKMREMSPASPSSSEAADGMAAMAMNMRLPGLDDFFARWIFRLDGQTQQSLLAGLGGKLGEKLGETLGGRFAWVWLLVGAGLASALVIAVGQFVAWRRELRHLPAPQRAWNRLARLLARRGFRRKASESPSAFARRIGAAHPLWGEPMAALANAYNDWRYADAHTASRADAPQRINTLARRLHNLILADTGAPRQTPSPQASSSQT